MFWFNISVGELVKCDASHFTSSPTLILNQNIGIVFISFICLQSKKNGEVLI